MQILNKAELFCIHYDKHQLSESMQAAFYQVLKLVTVQNLVPKPSKNMPEVFSETVIQVHHSTRTVKNKQQYTASTEQ